MRGVGRNVPIHEYSRLKVDDLASIQLHRSDPFASRFRMALFVPLRHLLEKGSHSEPLVL